jgi:hypothetical protein
VVESSKKEDVKVVAVEAVKTVDKAKVAPVEAVKTVDKAQPTGKA